MLFQINTVVLRAPQCRKNNAFGRKKTLYEFITAALVPLSMSVLLSYKKAVK
jgi:hypothetical protein